MGSADLTQVLRRSLGLSHLGARPDPELTSRPASEPGSERGHGARDATGTTALKNTMNLAHVTAGLRVVLAALILVVLSNETGGGHGGAIGPVAVAYLVFALVMIAPATLRSPNAAVTLVQELVEVAFFTAFIVLSGGHGSPFFVCYGFLLLVASLSGDWRATLRVAGIQMTLFGLVVLADMRAVGWASLDVDRLLLRMGFLAAGGALLALFAHQSAALGLLPSHERGSARPGPLPALADFSTERIIAQGRVLLAGFSLFAIWIDPVQPEAHPSLVYVILACYFLASIGIVFLVRSLSASELIRHLTHGVDILYVTSVVALTGGMSSSLFVTFTLIVIVATLRWDWRGAVGTTAVLLVAFVSIVLVDADRFRSERPELDRVIMRIAFLFIAGTMMAYVGFIRQTSREQIAALTSGGTARGLGGATGLSELLLRTRDLLGCERLLAIWRTEDEPHVRIAEVDARGVRFEKRPPQAWDNIALPATSRLGCYVDLDRRRIVDEYGVRAMSTLPIAAELSEAFGIRKCLVAPFTGNFCDGYLLCLETLQPSMKRESWGAIAAARLAIEVDNMVVREQASGMAAERERQRLARDLHDGVLQGLTAATLHIGNLQADVSGEANARLETIRKLLLSEQRKLRGVVDANRPAPAAIRVPLIPALQPHADDLSRQWACSVEVQGTDRSDVSPSFLHQFVHIIRESVANAVRHGRAKRIVVDVAGDVEQYRVEIKDDGSGLPSGAGRFNMDDMKARRLMPLSVWDRIKDMGGHLQVDSSDRGVTLRITLPRI
jgi:signal transduction histidine kinase